MCDNNPHRFVFIDLCVRLVEAAQHGDYTQSERIVAATKLIEEFWPSANPRNDKDN